MSAIRTTLFFSRNANGHFYTSPLSKLRICGAFIGSLIGYGIFSKKNSVRAISRTDFEKGSELIDTKEYRDLSRASGGKTPVYLPRGLPIILKQCGHLCEERLSKMDKAQKICESIEARRLIIPKARRHGDFLIEDRIPFSSVDPLEQMGLYINNKEKFTPAIRELTAFFCRASICDLGDFRSCFSSRKEHNGLYFHSPIPRFDNIPLYIENGEGKIGLIDLESFSPIPNHDNCHWSDLISFFPYHAKDILDVVQRMKSNGSFVDSDSLSQNALNELLRNGLAMYEKSYVEHQRFLAQQGINSKTAFQFQIDPNRFSAIQESMKKRFDKGEFCKIHLREDSPHPLGSSRLNEEEKKKLRAFADRVIPEAIGLLQNELEISLSKCKEPKRDLVSCRTVKISDQQRSRIEQYLLSQKNLLLPEKEQSGRTIQLVPEYILFALLNTMLQEGALYDFYNSDFRDYAFRF